MNYEKMIAVNRIESEQKIIDTRNQDLNTLIKILLVKPPYPGIL